MTKKLYGYLLGAAAVILVIAVVVIHHNNNPTSMSGLENTSQSAVSTNSVKIQNYMFNPMVIKVKVGTTVTWTNDDQVHHSITADNASKYAPNSQLIGQGQTYQFKFTKAGTYTFHCMPHPYMHGTVIVVN